MSFQNPQMAYEDPEDRFGPECGYCGRDTNDHDNDCPEEDKFENALDEAADRKYEEMRERRYE